MIDGLVSQSRRVEGVKPLDPANARDSAEVSRHHSGTPGTSKKALFSRLPRQLVPQTFSEDHLGGKLHPVSHSHVLCVCARCVCVCLCVFVCVCSAVFRFPPVEVHAGVGLGGGQAVGRASAMSTRIRAACPKPIRVDEGLAAFWLDSILSL